MIRTLYHIEAPGTVPYANQALETYLLDAAGEEECILYLWQNRKTVVIGRNQNAWTECRCRQLEADGGYLARRLSGGGAVFHDGGNLNFTFLVSRHNYDVVRQTSVILRAVQKSGIAAECSGRNDLTVDGRKFSGNAYYQKETSCYHHGTLLLRSDKAELEKYLTVSKRKLESKSVSSVKSRVVNLCELMPDIGVSGMKEKLLEAFSEVYALPVMPFPESRLDTAAVSAYEKKFASWDWKYGRNVRFTCEQSGHFLWGEVLIQLRIEGGCIRDAALWSDALDTDFIQAVQEALPGIRFSEDAVQQKIAALNPDTELRCQEAADISVLLAGML
jgi:lipoate---protein ligase